jgi:hypothetical protein
VPAVFPYTTFRDPVDVIGPPERPVPAVTLVTVPIVLGAVERDVTRPFVSTDKTGMVEALPADWAVVIGASVGEGYEPARSPPALPMGFLKIAVETCFVVPLWTTTVISFPANEVAAGSAVILSPGISVKC